MPNLNPSSPPSGDLTLDTQFAEIIEATPRGLNAHQSDSFKQFVPVYFSGLPAGELAELNPEDLAGLCFAHWRLGQQRSPDQVKLKVFNPSIEAQGWQSGHTIIQLVAPDQAYLVSSLRSVLITSGRSVHMLLHPLFAVTRDEQHQCTDLSAVATAKNSPDKTTLESLIHIEIDSVPDTELEEVEALLLRTLDTLQLLHDDASKMGEQLLNLGNKPLDEEQSRFISWLAEKEFVCLGIAQVPVAGDVLGNADNPNGLGLLSSTASENFVSVNELIPGETLEALNTVNNDLIVCKASARSPVVRCDYPDLIILIDRDSDNQVVTLHCVLGLFVAGLQGEANDNIPMLRERVESAISASNTAPNSHDANALQSVLRGFPKDMLLQSTAPALLDMAQGIVALHERQQIRLFHSSDLMGRFCNCLIYIPRESYSRELRLDIESILVNMIDGNLSEFDIQFSSASALARLHFVVQKSPPLSRPIDWHSVEKRITQAAVTWNDRLMHTLQSKNNEHDALVLYRRYANAFPASYREDYSARIAVSDIEFIEAMQDQNAPVMSFYRHIVADADTINFKLFSHRQSVSLSDVIPVIENMGLRVEAEHPFEIKPLGKSTIWMHEFTVEQAGQSKLDPKTAAIYIQDAFSHIWSGDVENDGFNRLILQAGLTYKQVVLLRSYCK